MAITRTAIGRVVPSYTGDWSVSQEYSKLDCVLYNGSTYIALQTTIGNLPTNTTYWQLLASKGEAGDGDVSKVDGISPDSGNVPLTAVRYGVAQGLNSTQQAQARQNIDAQQAGDYITPTIKVAGQYLRFEGEDIWSTHEIDVLPSGGSAGNFLKKASSGTEWATVHEIPSGGAQGAVLTKTSGNDYELSWSSIGAISSSDIDSIISGS